MKLLFSLLLVVSLFAADFRISTTKPGNKFALGATPLSKEALALHMDFDFLQWVDPKQSTVACSDPRITRAIVGAPGGDFGEYIVALEALQTGFLTNVTANQTVQDELFTGLMDNLLSVSRKFYFHTDTTAVAAIATALGINKTELNLLNPNFTLIDKTTLEGLLVTPALQGCHHLKNMMLDPATYQVKSGLILIQQAILAFYHYAWKSEANRAKIFFEILEGNDTPKAIGIIDAEGYFPGQLLPMGIPKTSNEAVIIYHPGAAMTVRGFLASFMYEAVKSRITADALMSEMETIDTVQVYQTLFVSAKNIPWHSVFAYWQVSLEFLIVGLCFIVGTGIAAALAIYFAIRWRCLKHATQAQAQPAPHA